MSTDNLTTIVSTDMKAGDWITLAAVVVALIIGVASLIQTHQLQKKERKERLLNEIIGWARGLEYRTFPSREKSLTREFREDLDMARKGIADIWLKQRELEDKVAMLQKLDRVINEGNEYIERLAFQLDKELGVAVHKVANNMKTRIELLSNVEEYDVDDFKREVQLIMELIADETKSIDSIDLSKTGRSRVLLSRNAGAIKKSVSNLIEQAVKIKTKDIR